MAPRVSRHAALDTAQNPLVQIQLAKSSAGSQDSRGMAVGFQPVKRNGDRLEEHGQDERVEDHGRRTEQDDADRGHRGKCDHQGRPRHGRPCRRRKHEEQQESGDTLDEP